MNSHKIIIIGSKGSGKTSLCQSFRKNESSREFQIEGRTVTLEVHDNDYSVQADAVMVVIDLTAVSSLPFVYQWLDEKAEGRHKSLPYLFVGSKADVNEKEQHVDQDYIDELMGSVPKDGLYAGYVKASAWNNPDDRNVDVLFTHLMQFLLKLKQGNVRNTRRKLSDGTNIIEIREGGPGFSSRTFIKKETRENKIKHLFDSKWKITSGSQTDKFLAMLELYHRSNPSNHVVGELLSTYQEEGYQHGDRNSLYCDIGYLLFQMSKKTRMNGHDQDLMTLFHVLELHTGIKSILFQTRKGEDIHKFFEDNENIIETNYQKNWMDILANGKFKRNWIKKGREDYGLEYKEGRSKELSVLDQPNMFFIQQFYYFGLIKMEDILYFATEGNCDFNIRKCLVRLLYVFFQLRFFMPVDPDVLLSRYKGIHDVKGILGIKGGVFLDVLEKKQYSTLILLFCEANKIKISNQSFENINQSENNINVKFGELLGLVKKPVMSLYIISILKKIRQDKFDTMRHYLTLIQKRNFFREWNLIEGTYFTSFNIKKRMNEILYWAIKHHDPDVVEYLLSTKKDYLSLRKLESKWNFDKKDPTDPNWFAVASMTPVQGAIHFARILLDNEADFPVANREEKLDSLYKIIYLFKVWDIDSLNVMDSEFNDAYDYLRQLEQSKIVYEQRSTTSNSCGEEDEINRYTNQVTMQGFRMFSGSSGQPHEEEKSPDYKYTGPL